MSIMLEHHQKDDFASELCQLLQKLQQQIDASDIRSSSNSPMLVEFYRRSTYQLWLAIYELARWLQELLPLHQELQELQAQNQELVQLNGRLQQELNRRQEIEVLLKRQAERERLIDSISYRIRQSLNLEEILETAVNEVRQFLQVDRVLIYRFKPDWSGVVTVESVEHLEDSILYSYIDDACFRDRYVSLYKQGRIRAIDDVRTTPITPCYLEFLEEIGVRANLVVPICQDNFLWGLLIAHHCRSPRHWEQTDVVLLSRLANQIAIAIQQSQLYEEVQRLATTDELTQVANRRRFEAYYHQTWRRLKNDQEPLSLIMCDIDFFKAYNDTYGHPAGDICLKGVAAIIQSTLKRRTDLLARYGGEEFIVVLPNTGLEGAQHVANTILTAIQTLAIDHKTSPLGHITLSLGGVSLTPTEADPPSAVIKAADNALYQAKTSGRNRAVFVEL